MVARCQECGAPIAPAAAPGAAPAEVRGGWLSDWADDALGTAAAHIASLALPADGPGYCGNPGCSGECSPAAQRSARCSRCGGALMPGEIRRAARTGKRPVCDICRAGP